MTVIDVHNHYYPPAFIDALRKGDSALKVRDDRDGNPVLSSPGDANIAVPGHRDIAHRQQVLDQEGVNRQLISLTCPGTLLETPSRSAQLARLVNDAFAEVMATRGERFTALATLPLNDPAGWKRLSPSDWQHSENALQHPFAGIGPGRRGKNSGRQRQEAFFK